MAENKKEFNLRDVIRVWYCETCGAYELDFIADKLFCKGCGYKMNPRRYKEISKIKEKSLGVSND